MLRARMHFPEAKMVNWPDIGKAQGLSLYWKMPWKSPQPSATVRIQPDNLPVAAPNSGHPGPVSIHPGCRRTHQALPSWDRANLHRQWRPPLTHLSRAAVLPCCVLARLSSALPVNTFKAQQMSVWGSFGKRQHRTLCSGQCVHSRAPRATVATFPMCSCSITLEQQVSRRQEESLD